jgi:uncharacterized protein YegL
MTDPTYTDITMVLDRSGSMQSIKDDTIGGFDAFISEQRRVPGRCTVSMVQFDNVYEEVYTGRDLADVPSLTLVPRGSTAMLDAIGRAVNATGARLAAMPEDARPGTVIVGIMTDGLENASREFTYAMVKAMIEQQEHVYGWTFMYMGANQDAIEVGASLGVARDRSLTYAGPKVAAAMGAYSASVGTIREAVAAGAPVEQARRRAAYSDEQRKKAAD